MIRFSKLKRVGRVGHAESMRQGDIITEFKVYLNNLKRRTLRKKYA